jgi:parallel beta-helix repeat protein
LAALGGLVAASAVFISGAGAAQTDIPAGPLPGDETWTASGSPYVLGGDVTVPAGTTLIIDAGTQVSGPSLGHLIVEGQLTVLGTANSRVQFVQDAGTSTWGGLRIEGAGSAVLHNASLSAVDNGLDANTTGSLALFDMAFTTVFGDAIALSGNPASVTLSNVSILGATTGLRLSSGDLRLVATGLAINRSTGCVVATSVSHVTIRNSSLAQCLLFGVSLNLATDFEVSGTSFFEWSTDALAAISSARLNISNNTLTVSLPLAVINLTGVSDSVVANNTLSIVSLPGTGTLPEPPVAILDRAPLGPNQIFGNRISGGFVAIRVQTALYTQIIQGNQVLSGSDTGIEILDSPNQTIAGNTIGTRLFPFAVNVTSPLTPWYYRQFVDANNTANGRAIWYLMDLADTVLDLPSSVGIVALVGASNVTVKNGNLSRGVPSLLVANSRDVQILDMIVGSDIEGLYVFASTRVAVHNLTGQGGLSCLHFRDGSNNSASFVNTSRCRQSVLTEGHESSFTLDHITVNGTGVISFFEGSDLTLRDAAFTQATDTAVSNAATRLARGGQALVVYGAPQRVLVENVSIEGARESIVLEDTANFTFRHVTVAQASRGFTLRGSSAIAIENSSISGATYGIWANGLSDSRIFNSSFGGASLEGIFCIDCTNVTFAGNTFAGNSAGLAFLGGSGCLVTRNFFFANTLHATATDALQDFDDGAVGNVWDDYIGLDDNGDGIGDTPYSIARGVDVDRYPISRFPDDVPPVAEAGPDIVAYEDAPVLLSAYSSSDDRGIRAYLWTFDDGGTNVTILALSTRYWFYTPGTYLVTLTVIDFGGNRASDSLFVTVLDRTPPHADAGRDRTVDEDTPALLDAGASLDNDPQFPAGSAFTWFVTDTNGTFALYGPQASWTFATPGNFTVTLFVDDASGFTDSDAITVTVRDKTAPVVPPLETPAAAEDSPFRVYGSLPTDNDPLWPKGMTAWFELWQGGRFLALTNASPAVFNESVPGLYTAKYFVSDASGNVGVGSVTFGVSDITPPDLSAYGARQADVAEPFSMSVGEATDNDPAFPVGAAVVWTVRLATGRVTLQGAQVEYAFGAIGDYTVALQVSDAEGNAAETTFIVHVQDSKPPVVSVTGPTTVEAGSRATFVANATDPSGLSQFVWSVSGPFAPRFGSELNFVFFLPGSYQVTVTVEDLLGHGANATLTVFVVDTNPPTVLLETTPAIHDGWVNLSSLGLIQATFVGEDFSGIASVEWAWGDGNVSSGTTGSHAYAGPGNYTVLVRAADAFGNANTTTFHVQVAEPPPIAPPGNNQTGVPASTGLPLPALVGLIAGGAAVGLLIGIRLGRGGKKPSEKEP